MDITANKGLHLPERRRSLTSHLDNKMRHYAGETISCHGVGDSRLPVSLRRIGFLRDQSLVAGNRVHPGDFVADNIGIRLEYSMRRIRL